MGNKTALTVSKLNNKKAYKYYVKAYKKDENGKKTYLSQSVAIHVAMKRQKQTNVKKLTTTKSAYTLAVGKTATIKASATLENKKKKVLNHAPILRYVSNNKAVVTIDANGILTAKNRGTAKVYVLANNGVYKLVKVTVK